MWAAALQFSSHIAQNGAEELDRARPRQAIQVTEQDHRFVRRKFLREKIGLPETLQPPEREMGVDDADPAEIRFRLGPDGDPRLAAIPASLAGQCNGAP